MEADGRPLHLMNSGSRTDGSPHATCKHRVAADGAPPKGSTLQGLTGGRGCSSKPAQATVSRIRLSQEMLAGPPPARSRTLELFINF
jgi:hypothetical protein